MVKKATVLAVIGLMLCVTAIGYLLRVKSQQGEISRAIGESDESVPSVLECATTTAKEPMMATRAGNVHWGVAKKDGRTYDCPYRIQIPKRTAITQTQSNCLARSFANILNSYREYDLSGMKDSIREVPDIVTNIHEGILLECSASLCAELRNRFLFRKTLFDFADADHLCAYLRLNMELVRFLGNIAVKRQDFDGMVDVYDALVLEQLLRYKHRYKELHAGNLEMCVDGLVDEWLLQIESENGFTRQSMWFQVDMQWPLYYEGTWTLAQLTTWVKSRANRLVRLGYTPKWLSEFDDLSEAVK